jgi:hypothetical protein
MDTWMAILGLLGLASILYYRYASFRKAVMKVPWSFLGTLLGMTSLWFSYESPAAFNTLIGVDLVETSTPSEVWLIVGIALLFISVTYLIKKR